MTFDKSSAVNTDAHNSEGKTHNVTYFLLAPLTRADRRAGTHAVRSRHKILFRHVACVRIVIISCDIIVRRSAFGQIRYINRSVKSGKKKKKILLFSISSTYCVRIERGIYNIVGSHIPIDVVSIPSTVF